MTKIFKIILTFVFFISTSVSASSFQEYKTDNGVTIWHMHNEHLPIISTRIVFPIGASHEASDKKGLVVMAASTMDEGAGDMKSSEFRKQLQDYNIKFSFGAAQDFFSLTMSFMRFDLTKAEELASIALSDPRFDQEQIDLIRNQILATIDQKTTSPQSMVRHLARQNYYDNHPYKTSHDGNRAGITNITQSDLKDFSEKLVQKGAFIVVVGDLAKKDVLSFADNVLSGLAAETDFKHDIPHYKKDVEETKYFVPLAIPQTHILFQKSGFTRYEPDYMAAVVASHILGGGGFGSRLMQVLREEHGLTYGASSYINSGIYAARFNISYATDNSNIDKSIQLTNDTLDAFVKNGISQKQLDAAVRYLKGYYPIQFNTNEHLAYLGQSLWENKLPADYPLKRNALLDSLTTEDVTKAAQKLITPPYQIFAVGGKNKPEGFTEIKKEDIIF